MNFTPQAWYTLKDGTVIELAMQELETMSIPVRMDGEIKSYPIGANEHGDWGFTVKGEDVFFRDIRTKK